MKIFEKKVINTASEILGVEKNKITLESDFYEDLNAEKIEVVDVILKSARICEVEIDPNELKNKINNIKTIKDLVDLIQLNSDEL
jgi:acyl carrier protein